MVISLLLSLAQNPIQELYEKLDKGERKFTVNLGLEIDSYETDEQLDEAYNNYIRKIRIRLGRYIHKHDTEDRLEFKHVKRPIEYIIEDRKTRRRLKVRPEITVELYPGILRTIMLVGIVEKLEITAENP